MQGEGKVRTTIDEVQMELQTTTLHDCHEIIIKKGKSSTIQASDIV